MISTYLNSLYTNCKALERSEKYDSQLCEKYFRDEISYFITQNNINSEENLLSLLIQESSGNLSSLLEKSALIKIFYLVNSLNEYNRPSSDFDELGRLRFTQSEQEPNNITKNIVLDLIKSTVKENTFLTSQFKIVQHKSYFFLSHDIDSLYGSLMQDGLWALKQKRFDVLMKLFVNVMIAKPYWFNIDQIMKLESEYDFKSTFYWLVNKGKIDQRQTNSDYSITSGKVVNSIKKVKENGFENGLHKSISSDTFKVELGKFPATIPGNRYHYLKYKLPEMYKEINDSGLVLDASLGFADHYGFRNNYGYPFSPYNFEKGTHYSFTEVPLNIMDGTFQRYLKLPVNKTAETIIGFLEKNKYDCLLSILWHNTFFTGYKYKGYREEYVKILSYLYESQFININQSGIIEVFSWKK